MSPGATNEFRKLDKTIQKRVAVLVGKIEASINPRFSGKALKGNDKEWRYAVHLTVRGELVEPPATQP